MARPDLTFVELFEHTKTPQLLTSFLQQHDMLAKAPVIGIRRQIPYIGHCYAKPFNPKKPMCNGVITEVIKDGVPVYRCTLCRNEKSVHHGPSAFDPNVAASNRLTLFSTKDSLGRPNRKINPKDSLFLTFCIAYDIPPSQLTILTGTTLSSSTICDWSNFIREICREEMSQAPHMGGVSDIVEVDESYLSDRRKYNRGRYLAGNRLRHRGHRVNNYQNQPGGPKKRAFFWVPDRKAKTLIPIVVANVAPGTSIYSDEWKVYPQLQQHGFHHASVNHSVGFVNPLNGVHTQTIERVWKALKLSLLKRGPGVRQSTIQNHLGAYWWLSLNGRLVCNDPFLRLVKLISKFYQV